MNKNLLINETIGQYMQEQGFEIKTDKRTCWEWHKKILDVDECVIIFDKQSTLELLFGNGMGSKPYIKGSKLLNTISNPRTSSEQWRYFKYEGDLNELYYNVLHDMRDIIINNWENVLKELAIKFKEDVPNQKHFHTYVENYEILAKDALKKYEVEGLSVLQIFDEIMAQIKKLHGKGLEDSENTLLELAALLEKVIMDTYGGERFINLEARVIVLSEIGRTRKCLNIPKLIFLIWQYPMNYERYRNDFLHWYNREEAMKLKS